MQKSCFARAPWHHGRWCDSRRGVRPCRAWSCFDDVCSGVARDVRRFLVERSGVSEGVCPPELLEWAKKA